MHSIPVSANLGELIECALPHGNPDTYRALACTARTRAVYRDDYIFKRGEPVVLALFVRGHGAFRRTMIDGQVLVVGVGYPGEIYGLTSLASTQSSVDLIALNDGEVAFWSGPEVRQLVENDPGFALEIIDRLSLFLTILTEKLDGFLHQDARRRVIRVLGRHRDLFFAEPAVLSRSHLPSLVGTSREMTGRVLRELEREGIVARVGRTGLTLLQPERFDAEMADLAREAT
jgi:CRP-like cAMP-binding protein